MAAVTAPNAHGERLPRQRPGWWLLLVAVLLAHLLLVNRLNSDRVGWGAGDATPARIEVAFVRDLQATAPPPAAPAAAPDAAEARLPAVAEAAAVAASAARAASSPAKADAKADISTARAAATTDADSAAATATTAGTAADAESGAASSALMAQAPLPAVPEPSPPTVADRLPDAAPPPAPLPAAPPPLPAPAALQSPASTTADGSTTPNTTTSPRSADPSATPPPTRPPATASADAGTPASTAAQAKAAAQPSAAASSSSASFAWPPSTRLTYKLSGHYRGPVDGTAQVEWLRQGNRYQVRMGTAIGPVLSRNIVSEGELTARGLSPRRFTGEQKVIFRDAKRWRLDFEPDRVQLADGSSVPSQPGVQDEASQFVQLTWLFTTQPDRLRVGQTIELPLVISRKLDRWVYDVVAEETLYFPFGAVPTLHIKPRREASGGDMSAEIWIAPTLQYLPVRILIRQSSDSFADLRLERAPEQAAR